ncbi:ABC transporter related protein [Solidesulfovibrio carbinoliphilus subsp. oakridgensis]|uniref:ABC transporter related protein n=1 Tax=Solidesulfovibrio carbinoliphilus subsp. oakridgensis TaxID=694327 RepID=G7Q8B4_9BACT|nr:ABC-F type ribosomal protection protein [Solidesulfovibrio carbinoliphilus]EHJ48526.1 ABC transporter related protein [Solidesulfovibrio carbinoliphilus subsp. oakridgensis]
MSLINISELSFGHEGGQTLFDKVSLQLDTDWKLGLIGRNGRGKTTFLKLLKGELRYSGKIVRPVACDYFPFPVENPGWTAFRLAEKLCPDCAPWQLEREASLIALSGEALERPLATLSGGETTKLLLAILFLRENHFLLIDEPTNHLDLQARQAVGNYLRGKKGFILVSHDRSLLDRCIDHVLSINKATIALQQGNFASWQQNRLRQDQYEQAQHRKLRKEVSRLAESAHQSANWSQAAERGKYGNGPVDRGFIGHKAAKLMQRAKSVEARRHKALEDASRLLRDVETAAPLSIRSVPFHGKKLVEASNLALEYDGRTILEGLSFRILLGDRLLLRGGNGSGKSSLARLIAGQPLRFTGDLRVPGSLRISSVPQDTSFLRGTLQDFARERGIDEGDCRAVLDRLGVARSRFEADMAGWSAGQKKKALLAASLCQEAHLYVWDEPLNYIDLESRIQLENLILEHRPTMLLIEHDRTFAERVASACLDLDRLREGGGGPDGRA